MHISAARSCVGIPGESLPSPAQPLTFARPIDCFCSLHHAQSSLHLAALHDPVRIGPPSVQEAGHVRVHPFIVLQVRCKALVD